MIGTDGQKQSAERRAQEYLSAGERIFVTSEVKALVHDLRSQNFRMHVALQLAREHLRDANAPIAVNGPTIGEVIEKALRA